MNCGICRVIYDEFRSKWDSDKVPDEKDLFITAGLSILANSRAQNLYRLDFKLRYDRVRCQRTFILKKTSPDDPPFRTPISHSTASDEVFQLAMHWITKCKCADRPPAWYPTRLIDLSELKTRDFLDTKRLISTGQLDRGKLEEIKVRLVEKRDWEDEKPGCGNIRYVTLSHRWGSAAENQLILTTEDMERFKDGIRINELPKTFRDAIEFASRLPRVGYVWIDSLCIKQGPNEVHDWLAESAVMDQVYRESFLNISATAAKSSADGLFFSRRPELLLEDEVTLNIEGIPGARIGNNDGRNPNDTIAQDVSTELPQPISTQSPLIQWWRELWLVHLALLLAGPLLITFGYHVDMNHYGKPKLQHEPDGNTTSENDRLIYGRTRNRSKYELYRDFGPRSDNDPNTLERCTILDASFWKSHVDQAPVNQRGWVLQERLTTPRVLHFCYDQIAWECCEFDAAEGRPHGVPNFQLTSDEIVEESRLKGLDPETDGRDLRRVRLKGFPEADPHLIPGLYAFELWRRIVEVYSKTALTKPGDKLIALSGIAKSMASKIGTEKKPTGYVAGLWRKHLASQLLWKVEPVFRELDSSFEHPSKRPEDYRAPTFSWASVDADEGNGITYGEVTDQDLLIDVEEVEISHKAPENPYGIVTGGHLILWGKLRKAKLFKKDKGRFGWQLEGREKLDAEEHTNVYLDCPKDTPFGTDDIYCLPAAKGERTATEESTYLNCLLLQLLKDWEQPTFRRIGLTKLSPWGDKLARHSILHVFQSDIAMPHQGYNSKTGKHRIVIV
ncbi:hypothetical protein H2201_008890 [Coniosporium apollinis]|uniref:Heterokaryon incompatibility domain-containing protein n=1 Tax=Coniosporium apollinis TaxID=61459 RepID=A0ABQ9NFU3_9PEZI|nr:hypothetical protein H2201_008890 [Coniosporium apollinis]